MTNLLQMFMQIGIFIDLIKWNLSGISSIEYYIEYYTWDIL